MLLPEIQRAEEAAVTAQRVIQAIDTPHSIDDHDLHITASIGISVYPDDGLGLAPRSSRTLTPRCITPRNTSCQKLRILQSPTLMNIRAVARQSIEEGLRRALEQQEFVVHYQPKCRSKVGSNHRRRGALTLGASDARHDRSGGVHSHCRRLRIDRATSIIGCFAEDIVPSSAVRLARRRTPPQDHVRKRIRDGISRQALRRSRTQGSR